jgi:Tol biopolymer transport system component
MKLILLTTLFVISLTTQAQMSFNPFPFSKDIGEPKLKGNTEYNPENQQFTLTGSGYNVWFERDEFHFAYDTITGDFMITTRLAFDSEGGDVHKKVGIMFRESDAADAAHVSAVLHADGLTVLQWRKLKGAFMRDPQDEIFPLKDYYSILQLERKGDEFIMRAAHENEPLQIIGSVILPDMPAKLLGGIFACAHDPEDKIAGKFWNVRVDKPVGDNYSTSKNGYLGCRLETMNVFTGERKVIYEKADRFEAPNWMPDEKKLLFNMDGGIYTIPVNGGELQQINTDFADRNNNDHGISFDGKMLAISHHRQGLPEGGSTIYVLPLTGGTPKLVTEETPSYWHGWAPNNKEVVFVAKRGDNNAYNVYKANISSGKETQLTFNTSAHVDGPEYSPDGKYIYYNSSKSGTMELWRMKPDGTGQEQLTFDSYNNWFPHISPDGNWIAYLAFTEPIAPNDHPSYKRVELKLIPLKKGDIAGTPKTIAYLYGGQGTINVPSWSPDSKHIAFVSNSGRNK